MLAATEALPLAVADQAALAALLERARAAIGSSRGDADAVLAQPRLMADQAAKVLSAGDVAGARRQFAAAAAAVKQDVRAFLDRVVAELGAIAKKKMDDNDLDVAEAAITRAEALQKQKADFQ
jgi:hypothetical protein